MKTTFKGFLWTLFWASIFTLFSYLFSFKDLFLNPDFAASMQINFRMIKETFRGGLQYLPQMIIPLVFWFLVGVIAYFGFFTIRVVYADFAENLYQQFFYTHQKTNLKEELEFTISSTKRAFIHASIILAYIILITTNFFLIPVAERIRLFSETYAASSLGNYNLAFIIGLTASLSFWVIILGIIYVLYLLIKKRATIQDIEEKHYIEGVS